MSPPLITVITATRPHARLGAMVDSVMAQSVQRFEHVIVVDHDKQGPAWARNCGAKSARGKFLIFSDDDVVWTPDAFEVLLAPFWDPARHCYWDVQPGGLGWTYGGYQLYDGERCVNTLCTEPYTLEELRRHNIISTMACVSSALFRQFWFDDTLWRLEDWDLWLRMGLGGYRGQQTGRLLFTTQVRRGLTFGGEHDHDVYEARVRHKLGV